MATNIWTLLNLRSNPFFQQSFWTEDTDGSNGEYPLDLLVGRDEEAGRILRGMHGERSSRHVIPGPPGVGKTTLAQLVKQRAARDGFVVGSGIVAVTGEDTAQQLLVRILSYIYQATLLTRTPGAAEAPAMEDARQLLRAVRFQTRAGGVQIAGTGMNFSSQVTAAQPWTLPLDEIVRLIEDVVRLACSDYGRAGVVVHLNNLENLGGQDLERAAVVFAELRDTFLLRDLHWLFAGTEDAMGAILYGRRQVASIMPFADALAALTLKEFDAVLERRYAYLRLDDSEPIAEPIDRAAALALYRLFEGDLRGTLRGLQEATEQLIGLGATSAIEPVGETALYEVLRPRYVSEAEMRLSDTMREHLAALADFGREPFTQQQVRRRLGVTQARVSQILSALERDGYVRRHGREGQTIRYVLAGPSRLAFGSRP